MNAADTRPERDRTNPVGHMRPRVDAALEGFPGELIRLKTPRETEVFLKTRVWLI